MWQNLYEKHGCSFHKNIKARPGKRQGPWFVQSSVKAVVLLMEDADDSLQNSSNVSETVRADSWRSCRFEIFYNRPEPDPRHDHKSSVVTSQPLLKYWHSSSENEIILTWKQLLLISSYEMQTDQILEHTIFVNLFSARSLLAAIKSWYSIADEVKCFPVRGTSLFLIRQHLEHWATARWHLSKTDSNSDEVSAMKQEK